MNGRSHKKMQKIPVQPYRTLWSRAIDLKYAGRILNNETAVDLMTKQPATTQVMRFFLPVVI